MLTYARKSSTALTTARMAAHLSASHSPGDLRGALDRFLNECSVVRGHAGPHESNWRVKKVVFFPDVSSSRTDYCPDPEYQVQ